MEENIQMLAMTSHRGVHKFLKNLEAATKF